MVAANSRVFLLELERQWAHVGEALFSGRAMPLFAGEDLSERWHSLLGGLGDLMVDLDTIASGGVVVASVARGAEPKAERSALQTEEELARLRGELERQASDLSTTSKALERMVRAFRQQREKLEAYRADDEAARAAVSEAFPTIAAVLGGGR